MAKDTISRIQNFRLATEIFLQQNQATMFWVCLKILERLIENLGQPDENGR